MEPSSTVEVIKSYLDVKDYGLIGGIIILLFKDVVHSFRGATKEHIQALRANTEAVNELRIHMDYMRSAVEKTNDRMDKVEQELANR